MVVNAQILPSRSTAKFLETEIPRAGSLPSTQILVSKYCPALNRTRDPQKLTDSKFGAGKMEHEPRTFSARQQKNT